jgi:hypothetical protein
MICNMGLCCRITSRLGEYETSLHSVPIAAFRARDLEARGATILKLTVLVTSYPFCFTSISAETQAPCCQIALELPSPSHRGLTRMHIYHSPQACSRNVTLSTPPVLHGVWFIQTLRVPSEMVDLPCTCLAVPHTHKRTSIGPCPIETKVFRV